jgi:hypothetical protein
MTSAETQTLPFQRASTARQVITAFPSAPRLRLMVDTFTFMGWVLALLFFTFRVSLQTGVIFFHVAS